MSAPNPHSDSAVRASDAGTGGPPSRYDVVLAVIPLAFCLAFAVGATGLLAFSEALLVASACSTAAMVDALFVNPPGVR